MVGVIAGVVEVVTGVVFGYDAIVVGCVVWLGEGVRVDDTVLLVGRYDAALALVLVVGCCCVVGVSVDGSGGGSAGVSVGGEAAANGVILDAVDSGDELNGATVTALVNDAVLVDDPV